MLLRPSGKPFRLSPSALNTFISCPRSFYFQYILGLRSKDEEEVLFEPNTLGSFVHYAMQYVYTEYLHCDNKKPKAVSADEIEQIRTNDAQLQQALKVAYEKMNEEWQEDHPEEPNHYIAEHHSGENVIIIGYVQNILERDREDAKTGLQIYLLEQERIFPITIDNIGQLYTGGKIDRLDIYGAPGNQCLRVVDYKSGSYNDTTHAKKMSSSWEELMDSEDKNYVRQTLIYSHAVMENDSTNLPIEPNLYFCRRKLTDIETTLEIDNSSVNDYRQIHEKFSAALQTKIKELLTTSSFSACEPDKCPPFCPFFELCGRKPNEF